MMSNIKKYAREFSPVTVTSDCGCKTFTRLNRYTRTAEFLEKALRNASGIIFDLTEVEDLLEELEDEAFWLCTARAEKHKGIEMW